MTCSICGSTKAPLVTIIDGEAKESKLICETCASEETASSINDLEMLETTISTIEEMLEKLESMVRAVPEQPKIPEGLESIAFTPLSAYKMAQGMLGVMKARKLELLTAVGSEAWLEHELKKAIAQENFEKSAKLRDELQTLKDKKA